MKACLIKRLLMVIPTVLGMAIVVFLAMRLMPGDPIDLLLADDDSEEARQALMHSNSAVVGLFLVTVLKFDLFGDGLRDALDPRLNP